MTPEPRRLRPYQAEAVQAVLDYWGTPGRDRYTPIVVAATGLGKSSILAALAVKSRELGLRVAMLAHRRELLDQMAATVQAVDPAGERVGIVQGERDDSDPAIVAASFQTLTTSPARLAELGRREVVLCDECHHAPSETYKRVFDDLGVTTPDVDRQVFACGVTATASRADGGLGDVWDSIVFERSLAWAIREGYLVTPRGLTVVLPELDLTKVRVRAGDYAPGELSQAMEASVATTVQAMVSHSPDRRHIVFAAGVDHANALAQALSQAGIQAAAVTGDMDTAAREEVYSRYRAGDLQSMVTVQVLTEGADFPMCDCVVMARPTRSHTLYTQMVGRAVRLHPGKEDALVLDLAGTVRDMSLVSVSDLGCDTPVKRVSPTSDEDPGQKQLAPPKPRREGVVELEDIDLLAGSNANWLSTPAGVRFLDCQDGVLVFLWPANPAPTDCVDVGIMHNPPRSTDGWHRQGLSLEDATAAAEELAATAGTFPSRTAPWRRRSHPSQGQVRLAKTLGIPRAEHKTRARLSDDISQYMAAARLDPYVESR